MVIIKSRKRRELRRKDAKASHRFLGIVPNGWKIKIKFIGGRL